MPENYKSRGRVFILGAGFSAEARIPLTAPLLYKAMQKFSQECPGIYERVNNYAKECVGDVDNAVDYSKAGFFSDLCSFLEFIELREWGGGERWSDAGSKEKLALRFYLAKTIAEYTPVANNVPDLYIEFAKQLAPMDTVISFNWDCLLEVAILRVGKTYSYNLRNEKAVRLAKLHGSVNWRLGEPNSFGTPTNYLKWEPLGFSSKDGGMLGKDIFHTGKLMDYHAWNYFEPLGELEPFLVLPGYGKAFDVRANAWLWYKPELAFAGVQNIFIIGMGLSHDDFFIRSYFLSNLPFLTDRKIHIVNPAPKAEEDYAFILAKGHAELWREPFSSKHVKMMEDSK